MTPIYAFPDNKQYPYLRHEKCVSIVEDYVSYLPDVFEYQNNN